LAARQRSERELLALDGGFGIHGQTLALRPGLESAVSPETGDGLAFGEGPGAVGSGPVVGRGDEPLLDALCQEIGEPAHLGRLLAGNGNRLVSAPPELLAPAREEAGLAGEVGVEVVHEGGELLDVGDAHEEVVVVGEEGVGVDRHPKEARGAGEYAERDCGQECRRSQEQATLDRPASDFEQCPSGGTKRSLLAI
jgi:hypothetical protein